MAKLFRRAVSTYRRHWRAAVCASLAMQARVLLGDIVRGLWGQGASTLLLVASYPLFLGCMHIYYRLMRAQPARPANMIALYCTPGALRRSLALGLAFMLFPLAITPLASRLLQMSDSSGPSGALYAALYFLTLLLAVVFFVLIIRFALMIYLLPAFPQKPMKWLLRESPRRLSGNIMRMFGYMLLAGVVGSGLSLLLPVWAAFPSSILLLPIFQLMTADLAGDCITARVRRLARPALTSPHNRRYQAHNRWGGVER